MEPNCPLTMVEAYNVDCNNWAKMYTCKASQSNTILGNPAIPVAQPHLKIAGKIICHKTMEAIWHAVNLPPYCRYLCNKLQWTKKNDCNVHWAVLHLSISAFQPSYQQQLILFINDKLPLWAMPAHPQLIPTMACPYVPHADALMMIWQDNNSSPNIYKSANGGSRIFPTGVSGFFLYPVPPSMELSMAEKRVHIQIKGTPRNKPFLVM